MNSFFEVNIDSRIGFKKLSKSDLGLSLTSNQTHIGLFEDTFKFTDQPHRTSLAKLIYKNESSELICLLDYIENPNGSYRSPKIRKGDHYELMVEGSQTNSVVRRIREIVSAVNPNQDWYLIWLGLTNQELVFYLVESSSDEYNAISRLIPSLAGGKIGILDPNFNAILNLLEVKIDDSNIDYLQNLEINAQTQDISSMPLRPRYFDIEKANKLYAQTGRKGEELIAEYFDKLKANRLIKNYDWVNRSRESSYPYDFEVLENSNQILFTDVKTTSYIFEQKMIFSNKELLFTSRNSNYHVYRVFDLNDSDPSLRICEDVKTLSSNLVKLISGIEIEAGKNETSINSIKFGISPTNNLLKFNSKISLS